MSKFTESNTVEQMILDAATGAGPRPAGLWVGV